MRTAFIETLCEIAQKDKRIWLLCADLGYSVLEEFRKRFPGRYVNVGVAEQNMIGVAAGLAQTGKIVFTYSMVNFSTLRCLEQIRNDLCCHNLPVKIISVGAGFIYGLEGYTHQGLEDLSIMRTLPNMTVVAPADPVETKLVIKDIAFKKGPSYVRLQKAHDPIVHLSIPRIKTGRAIKIKEGKSTLVISTGSLLKMALEVADIGSGNRLSIAVWSMPYIKPIDKKEILGAIKKYKLIVTMEEGQITGGLGSAVAEVIAEAGRSDCRLMRFGVNDRILYKAVDQCNARKTVGIDPHAIVNYIKSGRK